MICKLWPTLILASIVAGSLPASAAQRDLLAASSDEAIVLARVQPPDKNDADSSADHTMILTRRLGRETHWRKLAILSRRVVSIAVCDEDAKVLLDTGDWMTIWSTGDVYGPPAPGVRLISFAADHSTLWAVGIPIPVTTTTQSVAATEPAATQAASAISAQTQPTDWPRSPAIYRFDGAAWSRVMALPPGVAPTDPSMCSLAVIDSQLILAVSGGQQGIRLWNGDKDQWTSSREIAAGSPPLNFDILNAGLPPTVWLTRGGPGILANLAGERPLGTDGAAMADARSATRAAEAIRLFSASGDHLFEQAYGADGNAMGTRAELVVDLIGPDSQLENWLAPTLTVIVTMLLFSAARRGNAADLPPVLVDANLELAPLSIRFGAGTLDALPVLFSILFVAKQMAAAGAADQIPTNQQMIPFYVGCGIYLVYTIGSELLFGRTLGKWLLGLRIVTVDGGRPASSAILVRNLLRVIDLMLMWLPLAMMLFSPLRQRVGDLAAGTLVVRASPPPPTKE